MKCTKCGFENTEGSKFCSGCATKLEVPVICPNCGGENLPDAIFCQKCAARIVPVEYCRFCGGEMSPIEKCCKVCKRDKDGKINNVIQDKIKEGYQGVVNSAQKASAAVKKTSASVAENKQSTFLLQGATILVAVVMIICLLSKWITIKYVGWLGISGEYNVFDLIGLMEDLKYMGATDEAGGFIFLSILCIAVTGFAVLYWVLSAIKSLGSNSEMYDHKYEHLCTANGVTMIITVIVICLSIWLNARVKEESYSIVDSIIQVNTGVYVACILSIFMFVYGKKWLKYKAALVMEAEGKTKDARAIYVDLGDFMDSAQRNIALNRKKALKKCLHCGAEIDADAAYCIVCKKAQKAEPQQKTSSGYANANTSGRYNAVSLNGREPAAAKPREAEKQNETMVCFYCGEPLEAGSVFCIACGKKQEATQQAKPEPDTTYSPTAAQHYESNNASNVPAEEYTECSYCGARMAPGMKFCTACGKIKLVEEAKLPVSEECPVCGFENESGSAFCGMCGQRLKV